MLIPICYYLICDWWRIQIWVDGRAKRMLILDGSFPRIQPENSHWTITVISSPMEPKQLLFGDIGIRNRSRSRKRNIRLGILIKEITRDTIVEGWGEMRLPISNLWVMALMSIALTKGLTILESSFEGTRELFSPTSIAPSNDGGIFMGSAHRAFRLNLEGAALSEPTSKINRSIY